MDRIVKNLVARENRSSRIDREVGEESEPFSGRLKKLNPVGWTGRKPYRGTVRTPCPSNILDESSAVGRALVPLRGDCCAIPSDPGAAPEAPTSGPAVDQGGRSDASPMACFRAHLVPRPCGDVAPFGGGRFRPRDDRALHRRP